MKSIKLSLAATMMVAGLTTSAMAGEGITFADGKGKITGDVTAKYETLAADSATEDATAATARAKVGVSYEISNGLSVEVAGSMNTVLVDEFSPEDASFEGLSDVEKTRLSTAKISYENNGLSVSAGRMEVQLDDGRIITNHADYQTQQSLDAIMGSYKMGAHTFTAGITDKLLTPTEIGGEDEFDSQSVVLHYNYSTAGYSVSLYDVMVEDEADTIGLLVKGKRAMGANELSYKLEYAMQQDATQTTGADVVAEGTLMNIEGAYTLGMTGLTLGAGYQVTEDSFRTGLGAYTLGDAKAISQESMTATSLMAKYDGKNLGQFGVKYFMYEDQAGVDNGTEINVSYSKDLTKDLSASVSAAMYSAGDNVADDADRYIATLTYKF